MAQHRNTHKTSPAYDSKESKGWEGGSCAGHGGTLQPGSS